MNFDLVAENSKNLAKKYMKEENFGRAFPHYLVALKLKSSWREELKDEFSTVLCNWGMILDEEKRYNDLFKCYEQALEIFPNSVIILNNLGSHLLRCGLLKEAAQYFRKCLCINPHFIRATHNLENISNLKVERWHFRMLNDEHRNQAFREAILKKISRGFNRILDIGTGTGLLSLFCAEDRATNIYACDSSPTMMEIAKQVLHAHNIYGVILIGKHSSEIQIPEDIRDRISMVVTETFDAGLLGEGVLPTLNHAWKHLLRSPHPTLTNLNPRRHGIVIPFGATLFVTGLQLDTHANDFHLRQTGNAFNLENCEVYQDYKRYDTQDLSRTQFKFLTETKQLFEINFNHPESIEEVLNGRHSEVTFSCIASGRLDCIAVWFHLNLDEDIVLDTGPLSEHNTAWDQAVFPLRQSLSVEEKQEIIIRAAYFDKKLNINLIENCPRKQEFEVSEEVVKMLNNANLGRRLQQAVQNVIQKHKNVSLDILDLQPFPIFGLNCLITRQEKKDRLTCFVATENDKHLIDFVAKNHKIEVEVTVKVETNVVNSFQKKNYDFIVLNVVEKTGEIKDDILLQLEYLKTILKPNGIILPQCVKVIGQFIHCDWLNKASRVVDNKVTCGYNIKKFINKYQTQNFFDFDMNRTLKTICSEPFQLFDLFDPIESVSSMKVSRLGRSSAPNALVYWLKIKFMENCDYYSTCEDHFFHQAALLLSDVPQSDNFKFKIIRSDGLFSIEFEKST